MSALARVAARRLARARSSPTAALLPARSFAYKPKVEAPPHLQGRATQIRAFLKSPNVIADPYRGPRPWPSLSSFLGLAGWKQLGALMLRPVKDVYTLGKLQSVPGFTRPAFREEARDMYREISRMIAENHHTALRNFCSEKALQEIKREVKRRERGGWTKVDWRLVAFDAGTPTVLQGRMVAPNAKDRSVEFAQFTVRFESRQTYAAYDRKGKLVSGRPERGGGGERRVGVRAGGGERGAEPEVEAGGEALGAESERGGNRRGGKARPEHRLTRGADARASVMREG